MLEEKHETIEKMEMTPKDRIHEALNVMAGVLETLVGISLLVALCISVIGLAVSIHPMELVKDPTVFSSFLSTAATLVIGMEFVKLLCNHTLGSVLEVMLLVIARQMIVEHTSPLENLLAVIAVAMLYGIRKYLFIPKLDRVHLRMWKERMERQKWKEKKPEGLETDEEDPLDETLN